MLRFDFMFFLKCPRQNSDIGHISVTMSGPFICIEYWLDYYSQQTIVTMQKIGRYLLFEMIYMLKL